MPFIKTITYDDCQEWAEYLNSGQIISGSYLDFSPQNQTFCQQHGMVSVLWLPIYSEGFWWGVLGFDSLTSERSCLDSEIDALRGAASTLGAALAQYNSRMAEREQRAFAEALQETAALLNSTLNLDEVLDRILAATEHVVFHDAADIMLIDGLQVIDVRGHSPSPKPSAQKQLSIADLPYLHQMAHSKKPVILADIAEDPLWDVADVHAYLGAPILVEDKIWGVINLYSYDVGAYNEVHADHLQAFVNQSAIAIRNANLYEQAQELAILEERQRLARDLHDSVSQTLWTARMLSDVIPSVWEQNPESGRMNLEKLRALMQAALAEMRILLLELRPSTLTSASLEDLIRQLADATKSRKNVEVAVHIRGRVAVHDAVQVALYRIAQEALNNLTKHSGATHAEIRLECEAGKTMLTICDNGCGFDPTQESLGHLGLRIMHERAASIGATLEVKSSPSEGTQLQIIWQRPKGDNTRG